MMKMKTTVYSILSKQQIHKSLAKNKTSPIFSPIGYSLINILRVR